MPKPPLSKAGPSPAKAEVRALVGELGRLKGQFGGTGDAAREKLQLLSRLRDVPMTRADLLSSYHDLLMFLRVYPDGAAVLAEVERQLGAFAARIEKHKAAHRGAVASAFMDSGIVGTPVSNVFTYLFVATIARLYPGRLEIDWDAYKKSETANVFAVLSPLVSWHESDAIDNDDDFDPQAWLRLSRGPEDASSLDALLRLLSTSGLAWELQEILYESAEIPVLWTLSDFGASRTGRRMPYDRVFFQNGPAVGRTSDLRADLARPAAPLRALPRARGHEYVRAITEVLGSRCRELYPLIGSNPGEVYLYETGRGVQIVVYGSLPVIRLPLEANHGFMLVRNGVPIGYGFGALLFDRCELAINIFPEYRSGESSFIIERLLHLFVAHFDSQVLVIRPYQIGDDNEEALESGAFWFYYKLGFRPVRPPCRALAEEEQTRIAADRSYRSPLKTLKRLAKSDLFFHLDAGKMDGYDELSVARVGYAVTAFIAREFGGNRRMAERESVRRVARALAIPDWKHWSADEITGFHRMAPLLACLPGVERWSPRDRSHLARIVRAKGSRHERDYALLASRHRRFRDAVEELANETTPPTLPASSSNTAMRGRTPLSKSEKLGGVS
jgi:hypothetical protein